MEDGSTKSMDIWISIRLNPLRYGHQQIQLMTLSNHSKNNPSQIERWKMTSHDSLKRKEKKIISKKIIRKQSFTKETNPQS